MSEKCLWSDVKMTCVIKCPLDVEFWFVKRHTPSLNVYYMLNLGYEPCPDVV